MKIYPVTQRPTADDMNGAGQIRVVTSDDDGSIIITTVNHKHNWVNGDSLGYLPGSKLFVMGWLPAYGSANIHIWRNQIRADALAEINADYTPPEPPTTKRKIRIDEPTVPNESASQ